MFDDRLLGPGWAGEISDDEVFFIQRELLKDKRLAYLWGFAPSRKTRPMDAIRRVAMEGDSQHRNANVPMARPPGRPRMLTLWAYAGIDLSDARSPSTSAKLDELKNDWESLGSR